jgi:hypothetical protein
LKKRTQFCARHLGKARLALRKVGRKVGEGRRLKKRTQFVRIMLVPRQVTRAAAPAANNPMLPITPIRQFFACHQHADTGRPLLKKRTQCSVTVFADMPYG